MKLYCNVCKEEKEITFLPPIMIQFKCGNTHELTTNELHELFKRYGGER